MNIPNVIERRNNNFDFFRLLGALMVFFGHAILINRGAGFLNWNTGLLIGAAGANIFFIISGFLVTKSYLENDNVTLFIIKRFFRIYPALIFVGIFTVLIIGPTNTMLSMSDYFQNIDTLGYFKNVLFLNIANINIQILPGVFVLNELPLIINASLWTIPIEIGCYFLILLLGISKLINKRLLLISILLIFLFYGTTASLNNDLGEIATGNIPYPDIIRLLTYFLFGIVIYLYRDLFSISRGLTIITFVLLVLSAHFNHFNLISYYLLPILVISLAFTNMPFMKKITFYGDFSYGFYLFAFPIQQTVHSFLSEKSSFSLQLLLSFLITLFLAIFSHYFIEKPFLKIKNPNKLKDIKNHLA